MEQREEAGVVQASGGSDVCPAERLLGEAQRGVSSPKERVHARHAGEPLGQCAGSLRHEAHEADERDSEAVGSVWAAERDPGGGDEVAAGVECVLVSCRRAQGGEEDAG